MYIVAQGFGQHTYLPNGLCTSMLYGEFQPLQNIEIHRLTLKT